MLYLSGYHGEQNSDRDSVIDTPTGGQSRLQGNTKLQGGRQHIYISTSGTNIHTSKKKKKKKAMYRIFTCFLCQILVKLLMVIDNTSHTLNPSLDEHRSTFSKYLSKHWKHSWKLTDNHHALLSYTSNSIHVFDSYSYCFFVYNMGVGGDIKTEWTFFTADN